MRCWHPPRLASPRGATTAADLHASASSCSPMDIATIVRCRACILLTLSTPLPHPRVLGPQSILITPSPSSRPLPPRPPGLPSPRLFSPHVRVPDQVDRCLLHAPSLLPALHGQGAGPRRRAWWHDSAPCCAGVLLTRPRRLVAIPAPAQTGRLQRILATGHLGLRSGAGHAQHARRSLRSHRRPRLRAPGSPVAARGQRCDAVVRIELGGSGIWQAGAVTSPLARAARHPMRQLSGGECAAFGLGRFEVWAWQGVIHAPMPAQVCRIFMSRVCLLLCGWSACGSPCTVHACRMGPLEPTGGQGASPQLKIREPGYVIAASQMPLRARFGHGGELRGPWSLLRLRHQLEMPSAGLLGVRFSSEGEWIDHDGSEPGGAQAVDPPTPCCAVWFRHPGPSGR